MKSEKMLFSLVLVGAALMFSCRGQKSYTVERGGTVRIVHNLGPSMNQPDVRLEFIRKIGEMESEDENLMFVFPIHAARDGEGHLFVLDSQDNCIKKFDRNGKFLLKFGRHGQGPGEFQSPMMLGIAGGDRLIVQCMDTTIQIFDLSGRYIDRFSIGRYDGLFIKAMKSGNMVAFAMNPGGENSRENKILKIFDLTGEVLYHFGEPSLLTQARYSWSSNFLHLALDGEDNIYASFGYQNRVEKYSPTGALLMKIDRELPYAVEHRYVKEKMEIGGQVREIERLRSTSVSRGIGIDGRGRIWVMVFPKEVPEIKEREEFTPQEYNVFEVYDPEGVLLFHVPVPEALPSFDNFVMAGNTFYFIDPYNECCVFEYRIAAAVS